MDGDHEKLNSGLRAALGISGDLGDRKWDIVGMHISLSKCVCGALIARCYVLRDPATEKLVTVGSTCVGHLQVRGVILDASAWDSLLRLRDGCSEHSLNTSALDAVVHYGILDAALVDWYRPLVNKRKVFADRRDVFDLRHILNRVVLTHFDELARRVHAGDAAPFRVGFDFPPTKLACVDPAWAPTWEPESLPGPALCALDENVFVTHHRTMCKCRPPTIPLAVSDRWDKVLYKCAACKHSSPVRPGPAPADAVQCDCGEQVAATTGKHGTFYMCRQFPAGCGFVSYSQRGPRIAGKMCKCATPRTSRVFLWGGQPYHGCPNFVSKADRGCGLFEPDSQQETPPKKRRRTGRK